MRAVAMVLFFVAAAARADGPAYEALGSAKVGAEGAVRARDRALADALRRVVEQAVTQAAPEVRGRLYLISARARDFVPTYRVLEEGEADGQFQVRIAAQIDLPRLLRDLQAAPVPQKRIAARGSVILCPEDLQAAEYLPRLREALAARAEVAPPEACPAPGEAVSEATLVRAGAQAAFLLSAPIGPLMSARIRGTTPALHGVTARAGLRFIGRGKCGDDCIKNAEAEATEFAATPEEALAAAGRAAAERALLPFLPQLLARLPQKGDDGVLVTIEGLDGYAQYLSLLRTLSAMPGVTAAEPRRFARSGEVLQADVLLRTAATAEPLGAAIGRTPLAGLRLQVTPVSPQRLRLIVVRESALPTTGDDPPPGEAP